MVDPLENKKVNIKILIDLMNIVIYTIIQLPHLFLSFHKLTIIIVKYLS